MRTFCSQMLFVLYLLSVRTADTAESKDFSRAKKSATVAPCQPLASSVTWFAAKKTSALRLSHSESHSGDRGFNDA